MAAAAELADCAALARFSPHEAQNLNADELT